MPTLRNPKKDQFLQVDNILLETKTLSWRAKGLLCYLLSRPNNWQINLDDLHSRSPTEGRDAVRSTLKELENAGYLRRERKREGGMMKGWEYWISESPQPKLDSPKLDLPTSVNTTHNNTEDKQYVKENNTLTANRSAALRDYADMEDLEFEMESPASVKTSSPRHSSGSPRERRQPKSTIPPMFQNETEAQKARQLVLGAQMDTDTQKQNEGPTSTVPLDLEATEEELNKNYPTEEEFSCFTANSCPKVAKQMPFLWDRLEARNWRDRKFLPIRDWKLYVQGLEQRMEY